MKKGVDVELRNRSAFHEYFFETTYVAGMVLVGTEVKAIRNGKVSFNDAYCQFHKGELYVKNMHISEYAFGTTQRHEPTQERKLLLKKKELRKLEGKIKEKGYSIVPLKIFFNEKNLAKIEIGLGKGKKLHDKRQTIMKREVERDIKRYLK
ncbi:MAG: SsrA-binding protein [Flavihumibacter sp. CACIAM 22H1]|nr:MAG: SsrA-binding protein [Flavihumibacter sp. CACIAM 22H1]